MNLIIEEKITVRKCGGKTFEQKSKCSFFIESTYNYFNRKTCLYCQGNLCVSPLAHREYDDNREYDCYGED